jgi:hypothetical protein
MAKWPLKRVAEEYFTWRLANSSEATVAREKRIFKPVDNQACCGSDAPRAEKRDPGRNVIIASPSKLGNPHRTWVPTFPQQRRRRTNLLKLPTQLESLGLTDSCAEPPYVSLDHLTKYLQKSLERFSFRK